MVKTLKSALLGAALCLAIPTASQAATLVVNLDDVLSIDEFGDADNVVSFYNIGAFSEVVGFAYDLTIFADDPSWLSEAQIYYTDSLVTTGVVTTPGFGDNIPGTATYTGTSDLTALGLDFLVGADGLLRVEYAESFDDYIDDFDAILNGTITFTYNEAATGAVPEPATWATMMLGFGLVGGALRSRRKPATVDA